jgi:hypothetical protein
LLNINVTVRDVALNISQDLTITVDERLSVSDLTGLVVKKLAWPEKDISGQAVRYALCIDRTDNRVPLSPDTPLAASGILNGCVLVIGPVFGSNQTQGTSAPTDHAIQPEPDNSTQYTMRPLNRH